MVGAGRAEAAAWWCLLLCACRNVCAHACLRVSICLCGTCSWRAQLWLPPVPRCSLDQFPDPAPLGLLPRPLIRLAPLGWLLLAPACLGVMPDQDLPAAPPLLPLHCCLMITFAATHPHLPPLAPACLQGMPNQDLLTPLHRCFSTAACRSLMRPPTPTSHLSSPPACRSSMTLSMT